MKRCAGVLAVISAMWLAIALFAPMPTATAAIDTADALIPVNPTTTLEMHVTANCITAEAKCLWNTQANLRSRKA